MSIQRFYYCRPTKNDIYQWLRSKFIQEKYNGKLNTQQYRTLLGFARRNDKSSCERLIRFWFKKNDPEALDEYDKYLNKMILKCDYIVRISSPVILSPDKIAIYQNDH